MFVRKIKQDVTFKCVKIMLYCGSDFMKLNVCYTYMKTLYTQHEKIRFAHEC